MIFVGKKPVTGGGGGGGLTAPTALITPYNSTSPSSANEIPGTFATTAGRPIVVFMHWYSGNGVSGDTLTYLTIGTQGRSAGTGTTLTPLSPGIVFGGRSNSAMFVIDNPGNNSNQSLQYSIAGTAPRAMDVGVFEFSGADTTGAAANITSATGTVGGNLTVSGGAVGDIAFWMITAQWASGTPTSSGVTEEYLLDTGGASTTSDIYSFFLWKLKTATSDETATFTLPSTESWSAIKGTIKAA